MISRRVKITSVILALFVVATTLFARQHLQQSAAVRAHEAWQQARLDEMRGAESTWLNLAGLFWLDEGAYTFGADPAGDLVLKAAGAPARIGRFVREGDDIYFEPEPGVPVASPDGPVTERIRLQSDMGSEETEATVLSLGSLRWWIIARDGMLGVRVRDLESPAWKAFDGIESYPFDRSWQIPAHFLPFDTPREMEYPTVLGTMRREAAPGVLVFQVEGRQFEMIPFERSEGTRLFLVFGDETNGRTTYSGGRFLYIDMPDESGRTVIDFNRAYNPPCAFSDFSTCPQPLPENRLSIEVTAGEKMYRKPEHPAQTAGQ